MRFNTAIAAMMEFANHLTTLEVRPRSALEPFVLLLAPFAPHVAEELWQVLGHDDDAGLRAVADVRPGAGPKADEIEVPVQVNGKLKAKLMVPADADAARAGEAGAGRREGEGTASRARRCAR